LANDTTPVSVRLPSLLVEQIDKAAGKDRAAFLRRAITNELNRAADVQRFTHLSKQVTVLTEKVSGIEKTLKTLQTLLENQQEKENNHGK
jgi:metal-responsive CopG/Arc/MetJ family transcriptional regulator